MPTISIINIPATHHSWIDDPMNVQRRVDQIARSCGWETRDVASFTALDELVRGREEAVILLNAHGETLPMPSSWEGNWQAYARHLGGNVTERGWVFASICGFPLYWVASAPDQYFPVGPEAVNALLSAAGASVDPLLVTAMASLTKSGLRAARRAGIDAPQMILVDRVLRFRGTAPVRTFYSAGVLSGSSAVRMGRGFFLHGGTGGLALGGGTAEQADRFHAEIATAFVVGLMESQVEAGRISAESSDDEVQFRRSVVMPLLRIKGFQAIIETHGPSDFGRDLVCQEFDPFGNRRYVGVETKVDRIHAESAESGSVTEVVDKIKKAFTMPFQDVSSGREESIGEYYLFCSKEITEPARRYILQGVDPALRGRIHFMEGQRVFQEFVAAVE